MNEEVEQSTKAGQTNRPLPAANLRGVKQCRSTVVRRRQDLSSSHSDWIDACNRRWHFHTHLPDRLSSRETPYGTPYSAASVSP